MELDFEEVRKLLPQRFPFLMIDRVLSVEPGVEAVAVKNVSGNDILFLGHFPDRAVLPGAALIEAMAQTAIVLFGSGEDATRAEERTYYLGSVKARFHRPVVPGDQVIITVRAVKALSHGAFVSAEAVVAGKRVSEADIVFSVKTG